MHFSGGGAGGGAAKRKQDTPPHQQQSSPQHQQQQLSPQQQVSPTNNDTIDRKRKSDSSVAPNNGKFLGFVIERLIFLIQKTSPSSRLPTRGGTIVHLHLSTVPSIINKMFRRSRLQELFNLLPKINSNYLQMELLYLTSSILNTTTNFKMQPLNFNKVPTSDFLD